MRPTDATPQKSHRKRSILLRAVFGLITFALLFWLFDPHEILLHLAEARGEWVVYGFLLAVVSLFVRAFRWQLLLRHLGLQVPFWRTIEVYTISFWFSTFLPGSMGGDLYKVYDVARASSKKLRPAVTVIAERAAGVLALLLVASVSLSLFHARMPFSVPVYALLLAGVAGGMGSILCGLLFFDRIWPWLSLRAGFLKRILSEEKADGIYAVSAEMRRRKGLFAEILGLSILIQLLALASYYALALAITDRIPAVFFFTLFPLIEIASLLPLTLNGIGLKEGLLVFFLKMTNVGPAFSMSLGILYRLLVITFALMGGLLLLLRKPAGWTTAVPIRPGGQSGR